MVWCYRLDQQLKLKNVTGKCKRNYVKPLIMTHPLSFSTSFEKQGALG